MKLLQVCQVQYCQQCVNFYYVGYNTANNVSNFGGDPATQLIVKVYQMIKLLSSDTTNSLSLPA